MKFYTQEFFQKVSEFYRENSEFSPYPHIDKLLAFLINPPYTGSFEDERVIEEGVKLLEKARLELCQLKGLNEDINERELCNSNYLPI